MVLGLKKASLLIGLSVFPCHRVLDANTYEKWHRVLVKYLDRCTMSLVREQTCCAEDLAHAFCLTTIAEYTKSSMKDQIYKVNCIVILASM